MHIAIAGNIGSGKTTLTRMLAARYGWTPKYESVDFNPYLSDFYDDMSRWSFNLQIYFLNKRFKDVVDISKNSETIIQDRTIYEDAKIFAPDLLIYLKSSIPNLVSQIQKRGREYEKTIRIDYLTGLNERYDKWIDSYKGHLLVIDADKYKFGNKEEDFEAVTDMIDSELFGLFPSQETK